MTKTTTRKTGGGGQVAPADYIALVRQFPVRPLKSEAEHEAALAMVESLVGRDDLTSGQEMYLDALGVFIEIYEVRRHAVKRANMTPAQLLRELMEQRGMTVNELGGVIGSQPLASMILNGKRGISRDNVMRLAQHFRVNPVLFIDKTPAPKIRRERGWRAKGPGG